MNDQSNPCWWADDDHDADYEPRHACWLLTFADGTWQKAASWPPLSHAEALLAYPGAVSVEHQSAGKHDWRQYFAPHD